MNELNFCVDCPYAIECSNADYIVCPKAFLSIANDDDTTGEDVSEDTSCPF